jgi:hypothetical protein
MSMARNLSCFAAALVAAAGAAQAAPLSVVTVSAPEINCVFETDCTIVVSDTVGVIPLPNATGTARLQSRTFTGKPGAPAAGKTGYEYRVDLRQAQAIGDVACITALSVDFGAVTKLQYNAAGPLDDVFVVTKGGLGTIGLASAEQTGNVIKFTFSQPVCAADASSPGQTSFFFGLASAFEPKAITAKIEVPGLEDDLNVSARAPNHPVRQLPPIVLDRPATAPAPAAGATPSQTGAAPAAAEEKKN